MAEDKRTPLGRLDPEHGGIRNTRSVKDSVDVTRHS